MIHFQNIDYFYLLALVLVFLWLNHGLGRWRRQTAELYAEKNFLAWLWPRPAWFRHGLKLALWLLALMAIVAGLARPQGTPRAQIIPKTNLTLYAVLDCSLSMQANDVKPSRIAASIKMVKALVAGLPGARMGLIGFAGNARILCPATTDYAALQQSLDQLTLGNFHPKGSHPGSGLTLAVTRLIPLPGVKAIVLFTDGEATVPHAQEDFQTAAQQAARAGISIYSMGMGTESGSPIPLSHDEHGQVLYRVHAGKLVVSRLQSLLLRKAGKWTAGGYWNYNGGEIKGIMQALVRRSQEVVGRQTVWEYPEFFPWFVGCALACLLLEWMLPVGYGAARVASKSSGLSDQQSKADTV